MTRPMNWGPWNKEIERFSKRDTDGFTKDLEALHAHIKKLHEISPKDKAGWVPLKALDIIDKLQKDAIRFRKFLNLTH